MHATIDGVKSHKTRRFIADNETKYQNCELLFEFWNQYLAEYGKHAACPEPHDSPRFGRKRRQPKVFIQRITTGPTISKIMAGNMSADITADIFTGSLFALSCARSSRDVRISWA